MLEMARNEPAQAQSGAQSCNPGIEAEQNVNTLQESRVQ